MYEIGQVSRITGLSPHRLRAWEKRYNIQPSARSQTGRRLYDQGTIDRIKLLKRCSESGHRLPNLAALTMEQLRSLAKDALQTGEASAIGFPGLAPKTQQRNVLKLALVNIDQSQIEQVRRSHECRFETLSLSPMQGSLSAASKTLLKSAASTAQNTDASHVALAANLETLQGDVLESCKELLAAGIPVMLCYHFGQRAMCANLEALGVTLHKAPLQTRWLTSFIDQHPAAQETEHDFNSKQNTQPYCEPRFSLEALRHIYQTATTLGCECPNHLSEILLKLNAFETYSAQCPSKDPQDVALHKHIFEQTAHARTLLEALLEKVLIFENMPKHPPEETSDPSVRGKLEGDNLRDIEKDEEGDNEGSNEGGNE